MRPQLCFVGFHGQSLLLCERFRLRFLSFFFLACRILRGGQSFLLHAFSFRHCLFSLHASLFGLLTGDFGLGAAASFGVSIGTSSGFTSGSGCLSFNFGFLFHRHHARFFRGLSRFLGSGFDCGLVLLLPVEFFRVHLLLAGFSQDRRGVLSASAMWAMRRALRDSNNPRESCCRFRKWRPECACCSRSRCRE